ncbi:MAG: hypothetical protein AB7F61_19425 [Desulfobulbus sp.]
MGKATIVFWAALAATVFGGFSNCLAEPDATKAEQMTMPVVEGKKVFDAHDTGVRYHFYDTDMDFNFGTIVLGSAVNHGVEIGEAFYAASQIKDGDAASWQESWFSLARLAEARVARHPLPADIR